MSIASYAENIVSAEISQVMSSSSKKIEMTETDGKIIIRIINGTTTITLEKDVSSPIDDTDTDTCTEEHKDASLKTTTADDNKVKSSKHYISDEVKSEVVDLYQNTNLSVLKIADQCGINPSTVNDIINKSGIDKRGREKFGRPRKISDDTKLEILDLYQNNPELTTQEVADKYNIARNTVSRIVSEFNIPKRGPGSYRKIADDTRSKVLDLYQSDAEPTIQEIADQCGISAVSVFSIIKESGISKRGAHKTADGTKSKVLDLYQNNPKLTIQEIADRCGISASMVKCIVSESGIPKKGAGFHRKITNDTKSKVLDLYQNNPKLTIQEIADRCGISRRSVRNIVDESNIPKRGAGSYHKLDDGTKSKVLDLYQNNPKLTIQEIAKQCDICEASVSTVVDESNILKRGIGSYHKLDEGTRSKVLDLYQNTSLSVSEIADQCGISIMSVRKIARKSGIPRRKSGRPREISDDTKLEILDLYQSDTELTMQDLADKYNISKRSVSDILKEFDIPIRSRKNASLSDDTKAKILEMHKTYGLSITEIAGRLNLPVHTVGNFIRREIGLDLSRSTCKKFSGNRFLQSNTWKRKEIIDEYKRKGITDPNKIAKELGVSVSVIYMYQ